MAGMELSLNQRLALVIETSLTAERLAGMPDAEINHADAGTQG